MNMPVALHESRATRVAKREAPRGRSQRKIYAEEQKTVLRTTLLAIQRLISIFTFVLFSISKAFSFYLSVIAGSCEASSAQKKCLFSNKAGMGRRKVIAFVVRFSVQRFKVLSSLAFFFRLLKFSVFFLWDVDK